MLGKNLRITSSHEAATASGGEFQRNWGILICCLLGNSFSMTALATSSIGSFVKPISMDLGWSRTDIQLALLFGQGLSAIGVIVAGFLIDRLGVRRVAIGGLAGTSAGIAMVSQAQSLPFFYLAYSLAALIGSGASYIAWSRAITGVFDKRRGLALAISLSGAGVVGMFLPLTLIAIIAEFGWRAGYIALAACPAVLALPVVLLLFQPPDDPPARKTSQSIKPLPAEKVISSVRFWILAASICGVMFSVTGIVANIIPVLTDSGMSPTDAAIAQGSFAIFLVGGRLLAGYLLDKFWAPAVAVLFITPPAIGCVILMTDPSLTIAILGVSLVGMAAGAEMDLLALLASRYFRIQNFARVYSYLFFFVAAAGGVGPFAFAWLEGNFGSYDTSFLVCAALFIVSGPILLLLGPYPVFSDFSAGDLSSADGNENKF